jgi:uncharacterized protein (TIGR02246 family)
MSMSSPLATAIAATLLAGAASASTLPPADAAELQLRTLNHRFVNVFAARDPAFMQELTAADFRMIGADGLRVDRSTFLEALGRPGGMAGVSYDQLQVRLFGEVALLHGVFEGQLQGQGDGHRPLRLRYTDVFHWDGAQWRLVGAHNTPVRDPRAKALNRGTVPAHTPWRGRDPAGDDLTVLRQLNDQYVQAFRNADVAWYAAHLAPDYVVTNGDGSFNDRAAALTAFARPTFATQLRTFPVDQVHIRRFGDVALIEAENAYETKDGKHGISRYTDIWHFDRREGGGRWLCISAHITVFKAPA